MTTLVRMILGFMFIILVAICVTNNLIIPTALSSFAFGAYLQSLLR